jgi:hypothetical protein
MDYALDDELVRRTLNSVNSVSVLDRLGVEDDAGSCNQNEKRKGNAKGAFSN